MPILNILLESLMTEVTSDDKYNKQYVNKLDRALFDKAVALDPTSNGEAKVGKYVDWIIKNKAWNNTQLSDLLSTYDRMKNNLDQKFRDINRLDVSNLNRALEQADTQGKLTSKKEKAKSRKDQAFEEAEVLYNQGDWMIVQPESEMASQYFGSNTDWCTARQDSGRCMFNSYHRRGKLNIVYNKKTQEKWQLFLDDDGQTHEYRNSDNGSFDPKEEFPQEVWQYFVDNDFPESGAVTEAQIEELVDEYIGDLYNSRYDDYAQVYDNLKQMVTQDIDSYMDGADGDGQDALSYVEYKLRRGTSQFYDTLGELESAYCIDSDDPKNAKILINYVLELEDLSLEEIVEYSGILDTGAYKFKNKDFNDILEILDNGGTYTDVEHIITQWYAQSQDSMNMSVSDILKGLKDYVDAGNDYDIDYEALGDDLEKLRHKQSETDDTPQQKINFERYIHNYLKRLL